LTADALPGQSVLRKVDMPASDDEFRFLTSAEFRRLSQAEKFEYLARAVTMLERKSELPPVFVADRNDGGHPTTH
jgi:hypothetical protein